MLNTNLVGRLRNTNLPKTQVLFPVFEAVVNSIHSIDERIIKSKDIDIAESYIKVKIVRQPQSSMDTALLPEIIGFEIIDNGIGFNDENFASFELLDSDYKVKYGCKGIGRLLWLKAFKSVSVCSTFSQSEEIKARNFKFNIRNDIHDNTGVVGDSGDKIETTVKLNSIIKEYQTYMPKKASIIARNLLEHCLWYFIRKGGAPNIIVEDADGDISLFNEYDSYMLNASSPDSFTIKSNTFEITHIKLKSSSAIKHSIIYTAANRMVKEEALAGKIPGLYGALNENGEDFYYKCFVSSDYLTDKVNPERLNFNIPESSEGLFSADEISFNEIRSHVIDRITKYLESYLQENKEAGKQKVVDFVDKKAPQYRPILDMIPENDRIVDPNISDKDLELKLHRHLKDIESDILLEGHALMQPTNIEDEADYSRRIGEYSTKVIGLKKSDLANYVIHRKVILDLFEKALQLKTEGKYFTEDVIHQLIMPMRKESTELFGDDSNLWLVDERLAFHNFLASDKTLKSMPITGSESTKEPDLCALNIYDNPLLISGGQSLPLATITVVEIKRPMRNDATEGEEKNPIEQALGYLKRIREGKITTRNGRLIPNSEDIPGFCYVLCDITPSIAERCGYLDLRITADKMGYFGFHKTYNAYIEVISFDRLLNMAKERNKAFFDKLGLPTA